MSLHPFTVQLTDAAGNTLVGDVDLRARDLGPVEAFADEAGATPVSLPASSDDQGALTLWLPTGRYEWSATAGGDTLPWRPFDVPVVDEDVSADLTYVHVQGNADTVWPITHNLGKFAAVDVVDTGGSVVLPDVLYVDANSVQLTFGAPVSGKAFVN